MKQSEILSELIEEIILTHSKDYDWSKDHGIPGFCAITGKDGAGYSFSSNASKLLAQLAQRFFENRKNTCVKLELHAYSKLLRQSFVDVLSNVQDDESIKDITDIIPMLKSNIETRVKNTAVKFTHLTPTKLSFPEGYNKLDFGSVVIYQFSDWVTNTNLKMGGSSDWKNIIFKGSHVEPDIEQIHADLTSNHQDIDETPYNISTLLQDFQKPYDKVIELEIEGYEIELSRKLGRLVSKTAVDSINLAFASDENVFNRNMIRYERQPVIFESTISIHKDRLHNSIKNHYREDPLEPGIDFTKYCDSIGQIVSSLVKGGDDSKLSQRWATSLDWFAEGCRERDDALAITKMATALDILAHASKYQPIVDMLSNLLNIQKNTLVFTNNSKEQELDLSKAVKKIYNDSRSKFVHGSLVDRLESYNNERIIAFSLARRALIEAAIRLKTYSGSPDDSKAFRTM
ncbi:hypothetical protein CYQ88_08365 [Hydrogenovibrio sp. SC-1]|uniref:HEPN domain-containing protein n=1 Tax=Hydrogenovibrio sp. SC-1 TaxID=2065820 RepID=UPI000C79D66C|nr:HEPN domain-containing protein [Hydrogenovibrio sp. SC-1]PLA73968.1 hypothetical protein CYQ88_08365 [Hydrogenovibrio sp. SC-1]